MRQRHKEGEAGGAIRAARFRQLEGGRDQRQEEHSGMTTLTVLLGVPIPAFYLQVAMVQFNCMCLAGHANY